jgi:SAM-dependent methyltransferase
MTKDDIRCLRSARSGVRKRDDSDLRVYVAWLNGRGNTAVTDEARRTVGHDDKTWYAHPAYWGPQNKQPEWPDRVLCDQGKLFAGKEVLNLGCFYPEDEEWIAGYARSWIGIDFVPGHRPLQEHYNWASSITFEVADMRELPYEDEAFDVVTDFSAGDHLLKEDWLRVIDETKRVLRPGGHFLVCFANNEAFIKFFGEIWRTNPAQLGEYGYVRTDTIEEMQTMLEQAGFEVVRKSHDNDGQLRTGMLARKP